MSLSTPLPIGLPPLDATLGAFDAKTHFSKILEWVARGKEFVVTKHGRPVAKISPIVDSTEPDADLIALRRATIERMKSSRIKLSPGQTIEALIAEGRRW